MTLADYDTAAEKIAALKCTMMDPALAHIATANFTADDVLYGISAGGPVILNTYETYILESYGFNSRINNSDVVELGGEALIYIKDSDIVDNDPVDLYQNRLARILETDESYFGNGGSFTAGTYGSILVYGCDIKLSTGEFITEGFNDGNELGRIVPIPAGQQLDTVAFSWKVGKIFDVPSDW